MAASKSETARPLRADARNNRERILAAARDAFVDLGPAVPLEEISRRAGCGIATLYRRFPDREALVRAVVVDALERTANAAREAAAEETDPFDALTRYMHRALDIRTGAVIPALLAEIAFHDEEIERARSNGAQVLEDLIEAAHKAGTLRPDVTFADIGLLVVRLSRPLPGAFDRELNQKLGHRHLDLLINGLRPRADSTEPVGGPALELRDLQELGGQQDS